MEPGEVYNKIKDMNAVRLFTDMELSLAHRTPDAKENHKRDNLRSPLNAYISMIVLYGSDTWSVEECFQHRIIRRSSALKNVLDIVERFRYPLE